MIDREEVLGLLFGVADISDTLDKLYKLLEVRMSKKKMTRSERVQANVKRLRELAEKGMAELERKKRESDAA